MGSLTRDPRVGVIAAGWEVSSETPPSVSSLTTGPSSAVRSREASPSQRDLAQTSGLGQAGSGMPAESTLADLGTEALQSALSTSLAAWATMVNLMATLPTQPSLAQARGPDRPEHRIGRAPDGPDGCVRDPARMTTSSALPSSRAGSPGVSRPMSGPSRRFSPSGAPRRGYWTSIVWASSASEFSPLSFFPLITLFAGLISFHPSPGGWGRPSFGAGAREEAPHQHRRPRHSRRIPLRLRPGAGPNRHHGRG